MNHEISGEQPYGKYIYFWLALACWTILIVVIIIFFARQALFDYHEEAKSQARAAFFRDLAYRAWCSSHGGVYVPITEKTHPNPYLVHPERDVVTTGGKALTLVNPAWMTNDVYRLQKDEYPRLQSHIVSDRPINPQNACDEWETIALSHLLAGEEEYSELTDVDGVPYVRLIRPLITDEGCLKCHEQQGYRVGDVRGGISISRPVDDLLARKIIVVKRVTVGYCAIWIIGVLGILYGWRKTLHYNADRERTIRKLSRAKTVAEDANKTKTQFLANISHEIRTPMTAILGFSDLLQHEHVDKDEHDRYIDIMHNNARLLLDIINDLLDMTKIESGKVQLESVSVSPIRICEEVVSLMRVRVFDKPLELETQYGFPLPETIMTDPSRLRQILVNLIGNAIKFTDRGRVAVGVTFRRESEKDVLEFAIRDTGIGISEEQRKKIFRPFVQADASISRSFGGTGLGLVISQKLAQLLGGNIDLKSVLGRGSTFTLHLPVVLPDAVKWVRSFERVAETAENQEPKSPPETPDLSGKRVLIAEDGLDNQRLFVALLKKLNVETVLAGNGREAVDFALQSLAEARPFDLILMDMQMPIMDGCTATRKLRRAGWQGRIIALTANAMTADRERCFDSGADDYISKPVNVDDFTHRIIDAILTPDLNDIR